LQGNYHQREPLETFLKLMVCYLGSIADNQNNTVGTIHLWEANILAAILLKNNEVCMQLVLTLKTEIIKAEAKLSDAI
jgi:hypothetical protein